MKPRRAGGATGAQRHLNSTITLDDLLQRTSISDIVVALGGPEPRRGRCPAWYRDGKSPTSLSLDDDTGQWYDHGARRGGGILDLIQAARGCSRKDAAAWLASYHGASLDGQNPAEARAWAARRQRAERQAADLAGWRRDRLLELRRRRNLLYRSEGTASAAARVLLATDSDDEAAWETIWAAAHDDLRGDDVQAEIDRLASMTPGELAALRGRAEARAA